VRLTARFKLNSFGYRWKEGEDTEASRQMTSVFLFLKRIFFFDANFIYTLQTVLYSYELRIPTSLEGCNEVDTRSNDERLNPSFN